MVLAKIRNINQKIRESFRDNPIAFALGLLFFAFATYSVFIFKLGFYWDDWPPLLLSHLADKNKIWEYFFLDRPFQSWNYYFLFPICRDSSVCWQFSATFFRWTSAFLLYHAFLRIFPKQKLMLQWTAILFVVFPGFSNQFSAIAFSSHFIIYTVYASSLLMMVLGIQNKKRAWIYLPVSYLLTIVHLFSMEYFVGLEVLRWIIIFYLTVNSSRSKKNLSLFFLHLLPYLVFLVIYLYWRLVLFPRLLGSIPDSNAPTLVTQLIATPIPIFVNLIKSVFNDLKFLFITSWVDRLLPNDLQINSVTFWLSILIGVIVTYAFFYLFSQKESFTELGDPVEKNGAWIVFGSAIIVFGLVPIWSTLRQITEGKWSDRFSIPVMFGVAMLIVILVFRVFNNYKVKSGFLVALVALSISYQVRLGNEYRKDYARQKAFYTQLSWRIPQLQKGTLVYSPSIPTDKEANHSYVMGINLLYSSKVDQSLDYWFLGPRYITPESLLDNPDQLINQKVRIFTFEGSARKVVSVYMPDQGCLWVVNPYYSLGFSDNSLVYSLISNESLISEKTDPNPTLIESFIPLGPQTSWCYYFEKIDLARSQNDLAKAIELYQTSLSKNLYPIEGVELLPVVQSYFGTGNLQKAIELSTQAIGISPSSSTVFCGYWKDVIKDDPAISLDQIDGFYNPHNCPSELQ